MTPKLTDYGPPFTLTADHLKLVRRLMIEWRDGDWPFGAPGVSPKRPFANGDVAADIIKIMGWKIEPGKDDVLRSQADELYADMLHTLQIVLTYAGIEVEPGTWRRRTVYDQKSWERVGDVV